MPRRRVVLTTLISALLLGWAVFGAFSLFSPPDQQQAAEVVEGAAMAESYRFRSTCLVQVGGEQRQYYQISGAKAGQDMFFSGTVLGRQTELYLVEGMAYQQSEGGEWRVNEIPDLLSAVTLFSELDPAAAFDFSELGGFDYIGVEKIDGNAYYKLTFQPVQQGWVAEYFTDITYTLWLPRLHRDHFVATVNGQLREDPQTDLTLNVTFYDIDGEINITAPEGAVME